jgi:O-antigen ligase
MQAPLSHLPSTRSWLIAGGAALAGLGVAVVCAIGGPTAGVAVGALVAGALIFVYAPGVLFGFYLLIPFYKADMQAYFPIDLTLMLALANGLQIVPLVFDRQRRSISRWGFVFWGALLVVIMVGVLYAPDQSVAMRRLTNWVFLVCLPISAAALRVGSRPAYVHQLLWTLLGMGVVEVVLGLTLLSSTERLQVLGANTIAVSVAALLLPLLAALFALRSRAIVRLVLYVLIPASFVVALASGSRGPILMFAIVATIGTVAFVLKRRKVAWRPSRSIVALGLASIVVLTVTISQVPAQSLARFGFLFNFVEAGGATAGVDDSSLIRVYMFDAAFGLFEEHPLFGAGTAGFASLGPQDVGAPVSDGYPHNAALQFAAEHGLLGLTVVGGLLVLALLRRLPDDSSRALKYVLLFFVLCAMVSGDIFEDRTTWGLLMLILLIDVRAFAPSTLTAQAIATPTEGDGPGGSAGDPWGERGRDPTPSAI